MLTESLTNLRLTHVPLNPHRRPLGSRISPWLCQGTRDCPLNDQLLDLNISPTHPQAAERGVDEAPFHPGSVQSDRLVSSSSASLPPSLPPPLAREGQHRF